MAIKSSQLKEFVENSLVARVARSRSALFRSLEQRLADAGIELNAERGQLFFGIGMLDGINQRGLADEFGAERTTISRQLDHLVAAGLVERAPSPVSRREWKLGLTRKGRALFDRGLPIAIQTIEDAQKGVTPEDLGICLQVLDRLILNLGSPKENPGSKARPKSAGRRKGS